MGPVSSTGRDGYPAIADKSADSASSNGDGENGLSTFQTRAAEDDVESYHSDNDVRYVSVIFRDGVDLPIDQLEITIPLPDGSVFTSKTTAQGAVTLPVSDGMSGTVQVKVKDSVGEQQKICSIDLGKCTKAVIVRSRKVVAKAALRQHQQIPPRKSTNAPSSTSRSATVSTRTTIAPSVPKDFPATLVTKGSMAWWGDNGALAHAWVWLKSEVGLGDHPPMQPSASPVLQRTLSAAGQPVTVLTGPECPNACKLRLGRNNVFRAPILEASKRLGLIPQALCALIDCEAGKVTEHIDSIGPDGKPLLNKSGKALKVAIRELWNASAGNAQSGAAGLTQFLSSTWLNHVLIPGRYIHDQSVAKGWVKQESTSTGKSWVFVLANKATCKRVAHADYSDSNVQACLAMRMDPVWSINAAADYGMSNLKVLESAGFILSRLNDMNKAKLMYLMHHEGEGSGPLFIRNTLGASRGGIDGLRRKFATQLGANGEADAANKIAAAGGDVEVAYRSWLASFIDRNFRGAEKYFCSSPLDTDMLSAILEMVGGEKIRMVD